MNRRQKAIVIEFSTVIVFTLAAVIAMASVKDMVNRSEAMKAMQALNERITEYQSRYRKRYASYYDSHPEARIPLPPQSFIDSVKNEVPGRNRLGDLRYRAVWIGQDAGDDEVLAYSRQRYSSWLVKNGYIVLRLDGRVEWMRDGPFEKLLESQQGEQEIATTG